MIFNRERHEKHEMGSESTRLEMRINPQIVQIVTYLNPSNSMGLEYGV